MPSKNLVSLIQLGLSRPTRAWKDTCATLQLWTQIVGKIRLVQTPWLNHSWHVVLYVSASWIDHIADSPTGSARSSSISISWTMCCGASTSDGAQRGGHSRPPGQWPRFMPTSCSPLSELGIEVRIHQLPNEIPDAIRFSEDRIHAFLRQGLRPALLARSGCRPRRLLSRFRTSFIGKCSPVHFFWGSFDLAVTRFSGRRAPPFPATGGVPNLPADVVRDAYSHEVSSAGFWPGGQGIDYPAFYSYASPAPPGFLIRLPSGLPKLSGAAI